MLSTFFIVLEIILGLVFLIVIHEFGHFITAKISGIKVTDFYVGFGPKLFSVTRGETTYGVRAILLGGYVKMAGDDVINEGAKEDERGLAKASLTKKLIIIISGSFMNIVAAFLILTLTFMIGVVGTNVVKNTEKGKPAHLKLKPNDEIVEINDKKITSWEQTVKEIQNNPNKNIKLTVLREGNEQDIFIKTINKAGKGFIGVAPQTRLTSGLGLIEASKTSISTMYAITVMTNNLIYKAITGQPAQLAKNSTSIVGAVIIGTKIINNVRDYLLFIGLISLALAYVNLLPIPPLDAGRAFLFIVEKIKGSSIRKESLIAVISIGFSLLIALMLYLLVVDIFYRKYVIP